MVMHPSIYLTICLVMFAIEQDIIYAIKMTLINTTAKQKHWGVLFSQVLLNSGTIYRLTFNWIQIKLKRKIIERYRTCTPPPYYYSGRRKIYITHIIENNLCPLYQDAVHNMQRSFIDIQVDLNLRNILQGHPISLYRRISCKLLIIS